MRKNVLVGYTVYKKKKNRAVLALVAIIVLVVAALWLLAINPEQKSTEPAKVETKNKMKKASPVAFVLPKSQKIVEEKKSEQKMSVAEDQILVKVTCRGVENNLPVERSEEFSPGQRVYFYNQIMIKNPPATITHNWINPAGQAIASVPLYIVNQPADTWSYITLPPESAGDWQIKIIIEDTVVEQVTFTAKN